MTVLSMLWNLTNAQTGQSNNSYTLHNYPAPPPAATNIIRAEYFLDTDPGFGKATRIAINPAKDIAAQEIEVDLSSLGKGVHFLYLRTQDELGNWSHYSYSVFKNFVIPAYGTAQKKEDLIEAEYFIDSDPGYGNGIPASLDRTTDVSGQIISVNLTNLSEGMHVFYLRTKDASGKWSQVANRLFSYSGTLPYPEAPAAAKPIIAAEYFIDTDPGFGKGKAIDITPSVEMNNQVFDVPLDGLTQGVHYLYIRSKENPWSMTAVASFTYGSVVPLQWLYVKAEAKNETTHLEWATSLEVNTESFFVEHSIDGVRFEIIGELQAKGDPKNKNVYYYTHERPGSGLNFYRIRQTDKDGKFTYSQVVSVLIKAQARVLLSPNPVAAQGYVIQHSQRFVLGYAVFDLLGRNVKAEKFNALKEAIWQVDLQTLKRGIYTMRIEYSDGTEVIRFVKE